MIQVRLEKIEAPHCVVRAGDGTEAWVPLRHVHGLSAFPMPGETARVPRTLWAAGCEAQTHRLRARIRQLRRGWPA